MATFYGTTFTGTLDGALPQTIPPASMAAGKLRCITEIFTMASQASGSILVLGKLPVGGVFKGVRITASASAGGTATIAVGVTGATGKYRAAATYTAVDTPTMYGPAAAMAQGPLTAEETVIATIAAAALAAAGTLVFEVFFTTSV